MTTSLSTPDEFGAISKRSAPSVEDTTTRLTQLIEAKGMRVFAVIDQSEAARQVGSSLRQTVLVLFGSPVAGTPVMEAVPLSALDLPLKVLIWDNDGQTVVSYVAPSVVADRYRLGPDLGQRLAGIEALTDELVAP